MSMYKQFCPLCGKERFSTWDFCESCTKTLAERNYTKIGCPKAVLNETILVETVEVREPTCQLCGEKGHQMETGWLTMVAGTEYIPAIMSGWCVNFPYDGKYHKGIPK